METYGKAFGKRVACDYLKAKKKKKLCLQSPQLQKRLENGMLVGYVYWLHLATYQKNGMSSCNNKQVCKHK